MADAKVCRCGTGKYCHVHLTFCLNAVPDPEPRHKYYRTEKLQRCGGGFRILRKRVGGGN